jgi:hypothetical protein
MPVTWQDPVIHRTGCHAGVTGFCGKRVIERRVKIKLHDKLNALVNLGKHLGLFSERHLLGGLDGGEIKHTQHMKVEFVKSTRSL